MAWFSRIDVDSGYGYLLPAFIVMGIGMGLTMSPMSTAAMNAVHRSKAGVASGMLSMSRMVGGTFGVAVLGAIVATVGRSELEKLLPALPAGARERLVDGLGSGAVTAGVPADVAAAAKQAFVSALGDGLTLSAAVAAAAALVAWFMIAPGKAEAPVTAEHQAVTDAEAAPAPVRAS